MYKCRSGAGAKRTAKSQTASRPLFGVHHEPRRQTACIGGRTGYSVQSATMIGRTVAVLFPSRG
jgi:hypothetical protein